MPSCGNGGEAPVFALHLFGAPFSSGVQLFRRRPFSDRAVWRPSMWLEVNSKGLTPFVIVTRSESNPKTPRRRMRPRHAVLVVLPLLPLLDVRCVCATSSPGLQSTSSPWLFTFIPFAHGVTPRIVFSSDVQLFRHRPFSGRAVWRRSMWLGINSKGVTRMAHSLVGFR